MSASSSPMDNSSTIDHWLRQSTRLLTNNGVDTARLDCLVLLGDVVGEDRSWVLAHPEHMLGSEATCLLNDAVQRRAAHLPLAYIRGKAEFYGREFAITPDVLVPRPESETIIDMLQAFVASHDGPAPTIIDVGTGSGALAITAKLELPEAHVIGIDIDDSCLDIVRRNADRLHAPVTFLHGDLLGPINNGAIAPGTIGLFPNLPSAKTPAYPAAKATSLVGVATATPPPDIAFSLGDTGVLRMKRGWERGLILLCNLPYVPDDYPINQAARHEPKIALFAGRDGLDCYRGLFTQIEPLAPKPVAIITESLMDQHAALRTLAAEHGYTELRHEGLVQLFTPSN